MAQAGKRIAYFDVFKGLAIFLVVMGHVLAICVRGIDRAFIFKMIGEVHMPVFFFISGYFSYKLSASGGFSVPNILKRVQQLLIPFVVVSALWVWYFPHSGLMSPLATNLHDLYYGAWKSGYWFLLSLFEIILVYAALTKVLSAVRNVWLQVSVMVVTYILLIVATTFGNQFYDLVSLLSLEPATMYFPVFMFGVMCHKHSDFYEKIQTYNLVYTIAIPLFALTMYYMVYNWEFPCIPEYFMYIIRPIEQVSLLVILLVAVKPFIERQTQRNTILYRYFTLLGNESLGIYLLHYFFLFPLTPLQEPLSSIGLGFVPLAVFSAFVAFFIIGIALGANYVISKSSILSKLMLGK